MAGPEDLAGPLHDTLCKFMHGPCVLPRDGSNCFLGQATLMSRVQNEVVYRQMAVDQVPYPSSWREEKGVPGDKVVILKLAI